MQIQYTSKEKEGAKRWGFHLRLFKRANCRIHYVRTVSCYCWVNTATRPIEWRANLQWNKRKVHDFRAMEILGCEALISQSIADFFLFRHRPTGANWSPFTSDRSPSLLMSSPQNFETDDYGLSGCWNLEQKGDQLAQFFATSPTLAGLLSPSGKWLEWRDREWG